MSSLSFGSYREAERHGRVSVLSAHSSAGRSPSHLSPLIVDPESAFLPKIRANSVPPLMGYSPIGDANPMSPSDDMLGVELLPTSSVAQSVFNASNILLGVGILSLPYAFRICGWVVSFSILVVFMLVTNYTARIVARCLDYTPDVHNPVFDVDKAADIPSSSDESYHTGTHRASASVADNFGPTVDTFGAKPKSPTLDDINPEAPLLRPRASDDTLDHYDGDNVAVIPPIRLQNYADIGEAAFGQRGRIFIGVVFVLELIAAAVALVILASDSLHTLFPSFSLNYFKILVFIVVTPLLWLKGLRFLSYFSLLGVFTMLCLLGVVVVDGVTKEKAPGSLLDPLETSMFPENWFRVPMAFGLMMAGFAGHAVFPNIYREMKEPQRFGTVLNTSYFSTFAIYSCMASFGYLMFGNGVFDEITKNLARTPGYNAFLNTFVIWMVTINPITKYALTLQPVATSLELWFLRRTRQWSHPGIAPDPNQHYPIVFTIGGKQVFCGFDFFRILLRTSVSVLVVLIAVIFPGFERVMGLLGSFFSAVVSVLFPVACYLRLYGHEMSPVSTLLHWILLIVSTIMSACGTLWAFFPSAWFE